MLTPIFTVTQDEEFLHLQIKAPHASVADCDIHFEENHFTFYAKPYFLRLFFPHKVTQDGSEEAKWDYEVGTCDIKIPKLTKGQLFEDLDMLTKLLTTPKTTQPLIQVIGENDIQVHDDDMEGHDWLADQSVWTEGDEKSLLGEKYGFGNRTSGLFKRIADEGALVIDLVDPESKNATHRSRERIDDEQSKFSDDHYLSSLYDEREIIDSLIEYQAFWETSCPTFNDDERLKLKNFPKKEYIFESWEKKRILLGLVDILFAYAYEIRINEGEETSESNWTISKLSSTLSWMETFENLKETCIACVRRSLVYPLYRYWDLSLKVLEDVEKILSSGKTTTLKCLLHIHKLLNHTIDSKYILNDLYVTDYCIWIQTVSERTLTKLSQSLNTVRQQLKKKDVNLDLELLEKAAEDAIIEAAEGDISIDIQKLAI